VVPLPELHAVVEVPLLKGPWPWPIADRKPFSFIRLSGGCTEAEVGSVIAQLVKYNLGEPESTAVGLLARVVAAQSLRLPGGVQACAGEREINPSCCCGLEGWRAWSECLESGPSPWMGHDPAPHIEWAGELVRVWSDGGQSAVADAVAVGFGRGRFVAELSRVERDLRAFLPRLAEWASAHDFPDSSALCRKFDACFGITGPAAGHD